MFFLTGVAHYLFVPLAEAVVFAMLASYVLSRTLVPTLVMWFYRNVQHYSRPRRRPARPPPGCGRSRRCRRGFERGFDRFREGYRVLLGAVLHHRAPFAAVVPGLLRRLAAARAAAWAGLLSRRWMPGSSGCTCAPAAARASRKPPSWWMRSRPPSAGKSPPRNSRGMLDNIGIPSSEHQPHLQRQRPDRHRRRGHPGLAPARAPADRRLRATGLRARLNREFPGHHLLFPARGHRQPDHQLRPARAVRHPDRRAATRRRTARSPRGWPTRSARCPARWTCACSSRPTCPSCSLAVDRTKASEMGLSERDVANSVLLSLSGSGQVQPVYWLNPRVGIQYLVNVRVPEHRDGFAGGAQLDPRQRQPAGRRATRNCWPTSPPSPARAGAARHLPLQRHAGH